MRSFKGLKELKRYTSRNIDCKREESESCSVRAILMIDYPT